MYSHSNSCTTAVCKIRSKMYLREAVQVKLLVFLLFFSIPQPAPASEKKILLGMSLSKSLCFFHRMKTKAATGSWYDDEANTIDSPARNCSFVHINKADGKKKFSIELKQCNPSENEKASKGGVSALCQTKYPEEDLRSGINKNLYRIWDKHNVYYNIDCGFTPSQIRIIYATLAEIERLTCLRFKPNDNRFSSTGERSRDFIEFTNQMDGCFYDGIGRGGGSRALNLAPQCFRDGLIYHHLVHSLGFWHEQSRSDRDEYVTVHLNNIAERVESGRNTICDGRKQPCMCNAGNQYHFRKLVPASYGTPYDYGSIMHAGRRDFAIDSNSDSITPTRDTEGMEIGQRTNLSRWDVEQLNRLYNCGSYGPYIQD